MATDFTRLIRRAAADAGPQVTHVLALSEKPNKVVWSGAERHLRTLLPALVEHGASVEALVLATAPGPIIKEGLAEWRDAGVRVRVLSRRSLGSRWLNVFGFVLQHLRLWWALRARRQRLIHVHQDHYLMVIATLLARCKSFAFTMHNELWKSRFRVIRALDAAWLRFVGRRATAVLAISKFVKDDFVEITGCEDDAVEVVEYGIQLSRERPPTRRQLGWPEDKFLVGFLGRLVFQKNVFVLLDALQANPDMHAVLIGEGPLRPEIEAYIREHQIENVELVGAVEDASRLIPLFDVLCLPSRYEGLGLVLVEAMLQNTPIIASHGGAIPDILGEGQYGTLFNTHDAEDLARSLAWAASHRDELADIAERSNFYARRRFSIDTMVRRTLAAYGAPSESAGTHGAVLQLPEAHA